MLGQRELFGLLGGLLVAAFCANRLSRTTRVPDLIILMLIGLVLGPVSGWIDGRQFRSFTDYLGTFALILILFEAGTELNLREALRHFPAGVLLAFLGYTFTFAIVSGIGLWFLRLPPNLALLLGGVFGCTSSTMVMPTLQQLEIRGPVKVVLLLEAALGDVIAVLTVGSLIDIAEGEPIVAGVISGFMTRISISIVLAILSGWAWSRLASRFSGQRFGSALKVGVILALYSLTGIVGGSGLLAVLVFGLTLANLPGAVSEPAPEQIVIIFHSELSFLVRSFFFVLLGASFEFVTSAYVIATVLILAGLILPRFLAVYAIGWALRDIEIREREVILYTFPRGLVNAVLAIQVAASKGIALAFLPSMAFTIILITNLLVVVGAIRVRARDRLAPAAVTGVR